jgi:signal transduction histidine kinase
MLANMCNAAAVLVAFWGTPRFQDALYWAAAVISMAGYIYIARRRKSVQRPGTFRSRAKLKAAFNALALGSCWAALPLFFFQDVGAGVQVLIACLSAGMLCGGAFALASIPIAALCFASPIAIASFLALLRIGEKDHLLAATVLLIYTAVMMRGVFAYGEQLKARVRTQMDTEEKARRRVQKLQASGLHAIGGMASSIVHEVNQPLSAATTYIQTTLKLLRMPPERRKAHPEEVLKQALMQVSRAGEIVRRLRNFFMGADTDSTNLNLHLVIKEAARHFDAIASRSNIHLKLQLEANNDYVFADRVHVEQVLINLIGNAVDAIKENPDRNVTISTFATADGFIKTDVTDTGSGISESIGGEMFEPFTTTKKHGMGMGLAISRSIIEAHEGKIWAEHGPGGGATFSFILPLAEFLGEANRGVG